MSPALSRIRNTQSLYQLRSTNFKPDDRRWHSAPNLEGGNTAPEKVEKTTTLPTKDHNIAQRTSHEMDFEVFLELQELVIHRYHKELEQLRKRIFGQETLSIDDLDCVRKTMHNYCKQQNPTFFPPGSLA